MVLGIKKIKPEVMIIALDNTELYSGDIRKQTGRIADVYFYNKSEVTHCCELTPSYWLEYVCSYAENIPDDDDEREKIYDLLDELNAQTEGMYVHCRAIDNANPFLLRKFNSLDMIDLGNQDLNDYVREYVRPDEFCRSGFLPWER
jgi:hypothetical protein